MAEESPNNEEKMSVSFDETTLEVRISNSKWNVKKVSDLRRKIQAYLALTF